jgi:hypothetical protein
MIYNCWYYRKSWLCRLFQHRQNYLHQRLCLPSVDSLIMLDEVDGGVLEENELYLLLLCLLLQKK